MKVSLILATVGRTEEVGRCLRSLASQTDRNFEVVLVDQNNDDRLLPVIQEALRLDVKIAHLRMSPPSLSGARNLGIRHAVGDIVGFTDDDCWYEAETIGKLREEVLSDPTLGGIVGCWVEQSGGKHSRPIRGVLSNSAWRQFRGGDASSITLFLKRELFSRLGGFDERLGLGRWFGAAEETDFVLRALSAGARLVHCPEVRVHHHFFSEPLGAWLGTCRSARRRARGTGAIYAKHRLAAWVVMRGLAGPIFRPLALGKPRLAIWGFFIALGRLEGFLRWKLEAGE